MESKGIQQRRGDTISNAKEQLNNLDSIDGVRPDYRLISILYGNNKTDLTIDIIDPKKEGKLDILTKGINYARDYYAEIFHLVKKNFIVKEVNGRKIAIRNIKCHNITLGLDFFIFEILQHEDTLRNTNEIEDYLLSYVNVIKQSFLNEEFFIGFDGIYISCNND